MRAAYKIPFKMDTLYYGDCLEVMAQWPARSVDLIYLDPPFNSKGDYNIIFGNKKAGKTEPDLAQMTAFADTWEWDEKAAERVRKIKKAVDHPAHRSILALDAYFKDGSGMLAYLSYMAQRLAGMPRLLKDTGSIYLHCDPSASHFLKLIMDDIFGANNFRNEIVWHYTGGGRSKTYFSRKHDTVFLYGKSSYLTFNVDSIRVPFKESSGYAKGGITSKSGKHYTPNPKGTPVDDVWDLPIINPMSAERLGYPTQKPLVLLDRIIKASSNPGDVVLDPFCGCGTTVEAAHKLKRKWLGIDISTYAIEVIRRERMKNMKIELEGVPKDLTAARHFAAANPFEFEKWAVTRLEGFAPNAVQRGDGGIDGRALIYAPELENDLCIAQVKGATPAVDQIKAFASTIEGERCAMGIFITLTKWDTPTVKKWVANAGKIKIGSSQYNRLVMWSMDEYFRDIYPKLPPMAHPRTGDPYQRDLLKG